MSGKSSQELRKEDKKNNYTIQFYGEHIIENFDKKRVPRYCIEKIPRLYLLLYNFEVILWHRVRLVKRS